MSPHAVNDLASSFVQMAKAFEELPLVQAELARTLEHSENQRHTIQRLEIRILDLKNDLDAAHTAIRKREVERDDAELRFLEVEDKLAKVVNLVKGAAGDLGLVISEPKPEPMPATFDDGGPYNEPVPEGQHVEGSVQPDPIGGTEDNGTHASIEGQGETSAAPSSAHASDGTVSPGEGQSAADPTQETAASAAEATSASPILDASTPTDPEPFIKFSNEWYDWEARQWRQNHKAAE